MFDGAGLDVGRGTTCFFRFGIILFTVVAAYIGVELIAAPGTSIFLPTRCGDTVNTIDGSVLVAIPSPHGSSRRGHFLISRFEVTNSQYRRFVRETEYDAGTVWKEEACRWGDVAPVVGVSRADAMAYARWADLRLPTAIEWEVAAYGSRGFTYPWGNHHNHGIDLTGLRPVGANVDDESPYGCYDMAGNACEWTTTTVRTEKGVEYIAEGGCWMNSSPQHYRRGGSASHGPCDVRSLVIGFRCAKD